MGRASQLDFLPCSFRTQVRPFVTAGAEVLRLGRWVVVLLTPIMHLAAHRSEWRKAATMMILEVGYGWSAVTSGLSLSLASLALWSEDGLYVIHDDEASRGTWTVHPRRPSLLRRSASCPVRQQTLGCKILVQGPLCTRKTDANYALNLCRQGIEEQNVPRRRLLLWSLRSS